MLPIPFANPYTYPGHSGVDFPQPRGTAFRASGGGVVTSIDYGARPGHTVWVQYDNGPLVGYCHMDQRTTHVRVGQRVSEGTVLGQVGSLGLFSTGPHLHVEVAGHATTASFWRFFTPDRVVGQSAPAGDGTPIEEIDMPLTDDDVRKIWQYPVRRADGSVFAIQELADAKSIAVRIENALAPVKRTLDGKTVEVTIRQEIADAKSNTVKLQAQVSALTELVGQLASGEAHVDMAAVEAAAERGARAALGGLTLRAVQD